MRLVAIGRAEHQKNAFLRLERDAVDGPGLGDAATPQAMAMSFACDLAADARLSMVMEFVLWNANTTPETIALCKGCAWLECPSRKLEGIDQRNGNQRGSSDL